MTPEAASPGSGDSLFAAIAGWAANAPIRRLERALILATGLGAALLLLRPGLLWPAAACALTVASVAAWGLFDHRRQEHPGTGVRIAERVCVVIGTLSAILTGVGVLFWVLSSGWSTVGG